MIVHIGDLVKAQIVQIETYGKVIYDNEQECLCVKSVDADISIPIDQCVEVKTLTGIDRCQLDKNTLNKLYNLKCK